MVTRFGYCITDLKFLNCFPKKKYRLSKSLNLIGNILNEELGMATIDWNE